LNSNFRLTTLAHGGGCGCKIAPGVLADLLARPGVAPLPLPPQLLVGIESSDDAAVWLLNEHQALIATTDFFMPIVDDPFDFGRIAASNAISDIYAMGGTPIFALAIVGMPIATLPAEVIRQILRGGESVCTQVGIPIAGGHTIDSAEPIYGLVVLGLAHPSHIRRNCDAQPGDALILGKPIGVGILSAALKKESLDAKGYARLIATTTQLNTPGPTLAAHTDVHAMTDVTGFGLLGHIVEMMNGLHLNAQLCWTDIPLIEEAATLAAQGFVTGASARNWASYGEHIALSEKLPGVAQALLSDPQTAGGLLVACAPSAVTAVLDIFHQADFAFAARIGTVGQRQKGQLKVEVS